jgi:hypothetical protein
MTFKAFDIFSSLVPGFLFLIGLQYFLTLPFNTDNLLGYTAIAFLLGYILNTFGSWLEDFYFFTWGGNPSSKLLKGKSFRKIKVYNHEKIMTDLKTKAADPDNIDDLFAVAYRYTSGEKESRIEDYNALYAFSRTLLTATIIGGALVIITNHDEWLYYFIVFLLIFIFWYRCKQRYFYYVREILNVYSRIFKL